MLTDQSKPQGADVKKHLPLFGHPKTTIRFQLLTAVNVVLAVFVAVALVLDYRRDLAERLEVAHVALGEEATTMLPAILQMRHQDRDDIQQYIDAICGRMRETHSPGHHIALISENDTFQALAHHRATPEMLRAMQQAAESPTHRAQLGDSEIVVGARERDGVAVYVSERMDNIYRSVIGDIVRRLGGFIVLAFIAGGVINTALALIVTRPLAQLVNTVRTIGKGDLGVQTGSFHSAELGYLAREVNAMSVSLAAADRDRKMQMAIAREIQENLLPKRTDVVGLNIAHLFQPADDIGGDYYDVLPLSDGTWLFCVADVTGHGVPAAMSASMLKALLMQAAAKFTSPAAMLGFVNRILIAVNRPEDFVSMLLVRADPEAGTLEYASAGHEPAWLLSPTGVTTELPSTGMLLGIEEDASWEDVTSNLTEGHRLLIVTDGVSEMRDQRGEMFGRTRLATLFMDCRQLSLEQAAVRIDESLATFRNGEKQSDDVTAVLLELNGDNSNKTPGP